MTTPNLLRALFLGALAMTTACADAPITAAQLQDDGSLRPGTEGRENAAALFSVETEEARHQAQDISLRAMIDTSVPAQRRRARRERERSVDLRLHGEGLTGPLPVAIVWSQGDEVREQTAVVQPELGLSVAASQNFEADAAGEWQVEVYALRAGARELMLAETFELRP